MSLLPLRGESSAEPGEPRVLGLDGEEADEAFDVLSSSTTRKVLSFVYDQPSTPAEIRDEIGTSLQNVHYHLDKLEDADLIEPAGTGYSEKGTEMTIYAPSNEAILLFAGREGDESRFRQLLTRVFGVVFALATGTLLFDRLLVDRGPEVGSFGTDGGPGDAPGDGAAPGATNTETDAGVFVQAEDTTTVTPTETVSETATSTPSGDPVTTLAADAVAAATDPAVAFLLGGLFVLVVVGALWYLQR